MNEQLQGKIAEILDAAHHAMSKAGDFAISQLPDIAMQYVMYGRAMHSIGLTIGIILGVLVLVLAFKKRKEIFSTHPEIFFALSVPGTLAYLLISHNIGPEMMVWFAPKVWLLQQLAILSKLSLCRQICLYFSIMRMPNMSQLWKVPRMWDGQTVAVMASGPSMTQWHADMIRNAEVPAIAINNTWELHPNCAMLIGADASWWRQPWNKARRDFKGIKFCGQDCEFTDLVTLKITGREGYDPDPECYRTGGNGAYAAVHIAVQAGASKVILCGVDMKVTNPIHWHGEHDEGLRNPTEASFNGFRKRFEAVASLYSSMGVDIVNCSKESALECFRKGSLKNELA